MKSKTCWQFYKALTKRFLLQPQFIFGYNSEVRIFGLSNSGALSSVGSEHLPYKQGVSGSNPLAPTRKPDFLRKVGLFLCVVSIKYI